MLLQVKYPSRGRPQMFEETLRAWHFNELLPELRVLVTLDSDDPMLPEYLRVIDSGLWRVEVAVSPNPGGKARSFNKQCDVLRGSPWDVLLMLQDDLRPGRPDWHDKLREDFGGNYLQSMHYQDGFRRPGDPLVAHVCIGREAWLQSTAGGKYVYHPAYESVYCDNEYGDVQRELQLLKTPGGASPLRHDWIGASQRRDSMCDNNESQRLYRQDGATYLRRQQLPVAARIAYPEEPA